MVRVRAPATADSRRLPKNRAATPSLCFCRHESQKRRQDENNLDRTLHLLPYVASAYSPGPNRSSLDK